MEVKLKQDFEDKIRKLMKELEISGQWYLEPHTQNYWQVGSPFPRKSISYTLEIRILVPDDKIEINTGKVKESENN